MLRDKDCGKRDALETAAEGITESDLIADEPKCLDGACNVIKCSCC